MYAGSTVENHECANPLFLSEQVGSKKAKLINGRHTPPQLAIDSRNTTCNAGFLAKRWSVTPILAPADSN